MKNYTKSNLRRWILSFVVCRKDRNLISQHIYEIGLSLAKPDRGVQTTDWSNVSVELLSN